MTNELLNKAKKVQEEIRHLQSIRDYFREPYSRCLVNGKDELEKLKKKSIFSLIGKIIEGKTKINIAPQGWSGGSHITVDADFLEYCAKYYDKKIEEKEKEFENIS